MAIKAILALLNFTIIALGAPLERENQIVDCGADKAVTFEFTAEGNYALGWTIRPRSSSSKPVDWSLWSAKDPWRLLQKYDWDSGFDGPSGKVPSYELSNCMIDIRRKRTLPLPTEWPMWPGKNRGDLAAAWSLEENGRRFALVQNDSRFGTHDLWLVRINGTEMSQSNLTPQLDEAVGKVLKDKRPYDYDQYDIGYPVLGNRYVSKPRFAKITASQAVLPFIAEIPKSMDDPAIEGTVTLGLPEGTIQKVTCNAPKDDPFQSDLELQKVDRELNQTYSALIKQLPASTRESLRAEQRVWIEKRDESALKAGKYLNSRERRTAQIECLRAATKSRNAELKKRLAP